MKTLKKAVLPVVACLLACIMLSNPVMAASTNYFSKSIAKMNSLYGGQSNIVTVSSGSVSGDSEDRSITSVTFWGRLTSGSSSCIVYITSPKNTTCHATLSSTGTLTFKGFNGEDPEGDWDVYIVSKGTASTVSSGTLKVNYTY